MKKFLTIFLLTLTCICSMMFVACGNENPGDETPPVTTPKETIEGVIFESATFDYDSQEKIILVTGEIPQGVTVSYQNNKGTNAGTYNATAILSGENYNTLTLSATLTINKINVTGVSLEAEQSVIQDGQNHLPVLTGTPPTGTTTKIYVDDVENSVGVSKLGTYTVKYVISGANYNPLTLTCSFKIKLNALLFAQNVINSFGSAPSPWSFLPESFSAQNKTVTSTPDYSSFVNVNSIPTNGIGKQLSVVYNLLNKTEKALSFVNPIHQTANTILSLYVDFIDKNPEEYKNFSGTALGINFNLELQEHKYLLSASIKNVAVVLFADMDNNTYGAKVQLTKTTILKYTVSENSLLIAIDVLDISATQIEFVREQNQVVGYMYEYLYAGDKELVATSALVTVGPTYTTLIGTKGDFILTAESRNCEVYLNSTGEFIGSEVREELDVKSLGVATYNTLWYPLKNISGITNIKKEDNPNGLNADTIYINNAEESIGSKIVSVFPTSKKAYSRRFDIEFKKMYFYTYNQMEEEYEEVVVEVPMMFVQEENLDTFIQDFSEENKKFLSGQITLNFSSAHASAVNYGYYTLIDVYNTIKTLVTYEKITEYCKQ